MIRTLSAIVFSASEQTDPQQFEAIPPTPRRLLGKKRGVTTSSCLFSHLFVVQVRPGWCSSAVHLLGSVGHSRNSVAGQYSIAVSINMKPSSSSLTSKILVNHLIPLSIGGPRVCNTSQPWPHCGTRTWRHTITAYIGLDHVNQRQNVHMLWIFWDWMQWPPLKNFF